MDDDRDTRSDPAAPAAVEATPAEPTEDELVAALRRPVDPARLRVPYFAVLLDPAQRPG